MLPFLSLQRKSGWLAVLSNSNGLTLVHVLREGNSRPEVRRLETFAAEKGLRDALHRLRNAGKFKGCACTTLMSGSDYTVTQLDAPSVPKEERREALRWALKDIVSYPLDTACIEILDIPSAGLAPGRSAGVLVVSAGEQAVRSCVAAFEDEKIGLDALDIPELAQRNVAALFEDENRGLAFLRIDESGMMLSLTFHGELIAVRRGETSTLQLNGSDADQRARVKERLVLELQRSLDNFDRQYSYIPISKLVLACYPEVENLAAELGENIYVPVKAMDLSAVMNFSSIPELKSPQFQAKNLLAIGAALRGDEVSA